MTSRILLADDSITIQKVVNRAFADEGIEVVAVSSGDQAERQISDINPDLVLADIFMPGKNGYELCETIKQNPNLRHIPVVLLVGAFEPFDQAEARRVRADDHLTKPFEFRALIETVRKLISESGQPQTAPLPPVTPVEEETVTPLEPRATGPIAAPSFKLDLAAMSEPVTSSAPSAVAEADFPASSFDDSAPLDLDYGSQDGAISFGTIDVELAPEPAGQQTAVFGSPSWMKNVAETTGQMASVQEQAQPEPLDLGGLGFAADEAVLPSEASFGVEQASQAEAESPRGSSVPSSFASDVDGIVLDFEKSEMPESPAYNSALAFETEPEAIFEVLRDEESKQPSPEASADEADSLKTRPLDASPVAMPGWEGEQSNQPEQTAAASYVADQPEAASGVAEPSESESGAEMFAVDNPLGDLLSDDGATGVEQTQRPEPLAPYAGFASTDAFELQFNPVEHETTPELDACAVEQPPAVAETVEYPGLEEPPGVATESSFADELPVSRSDASDAIESGQAVEQSETAYAPVDEPHVSEAETVEATEWAESPFGFDSASQQDAFADSERDAYSTGPLDEEAAPMSEQATFTTATMWTAEEARFAPIDIEAVPVDEAENQPAAVESSVETVGERGFDFAAVSASPAETIAPVEDELRMVEEGEPVGQGASETAQAAELSPAAMDEIVRRVVAQISDAVVREIAWEVVPDAVERVIEKLARESLARKT